MIACVAGGTSGIGAEVAIRLLDRGDRVFVVGRTQAHANEFSARLRLEQEDRVVVCVGDLREPEVATAVAERIEGDGNRLDMLVNGVGTISAGGISAETPDEWRRVISTNLDSAFNLTKACMKLLEAADGAAIINISSVCSLRPCASLAYSVSKAALDMFTRTLARELAPKGIRVNSVNPGVIRTNLPMSAGVFADKDSYESWLAKMAATHPVGRIGDASEIAAAVLFLADTESSSWTTGAILSVDGGRAIA